MAIELDLLQTYKTLWIFGVPEERRAALTAALAKFSVHFPSVRSPAEAFIFRMRAAPRSLVLIWHGCDLPEQLFTHISTEFPHAFLAPSLFMRPLNKRLASLGYQIMSPALDADLPALRLLSPERVEHAQMQAELMAEAERGLALWRDSIATFAARGAANQDRLDLFAMAPEGRTRIVLVGRPADLSALPADSVLSGIRRLREANPNAWIAIVPNHHIDMGSVADLEDDLLQVADDVVFGPWRPDQAAGAELVASADPGIIIDAWLRGHAVAYLGDMPLGLDLSEFKGREVAIFATLIDGQILLNSGNPDTLSVCALIPELDAQVRTVPVAEGFALQDLRRGFHKISRLIERHDQEGARCLLLSKLEDAPEDVELWVKLGSLSFDLRQLDAAITAFDRALAIDPGNVASLRGRAKVRIARGDMTADVASDLWRAYQLDGARNIAIAEEYFNFEWERAPINEALLSRYQEVVRRLPRIPKGSKGPGGSIVTRLAAMQLEAGMIEAATRNLNFALSRGEIPTSYARLCATLGPAAGLKPIPLVRQTVLTHLTRNETLFNQLLDEANGDIAIVGNGPQELGRGRGVEIDSHDLVVRFNTYQTGFPQSHDYGMKTDLWVRMPPTGYVKTDSSSACRNIIVTGVNRLNRSIGIQDWLASLIKQGKQVGFFPREPFYELVAKLGKVPTAGLVMAYMLYRETGPVDPDRIYGCSFAADGEGGSTAYHHSDPAAASGLRHNFDVEHAFFQTIRKTARGVYHVPTTARMRARNVPTLSIDTLPSPPKPWTIESAASRFDRVLSVTTGLDGYEIFGHKVEVIPLKEAREIAAAPPGTIDQPDHTAKVLTQDLPRRRTLILGFGLGSSGQLGQQLAERLGMPYMSVEYGLISSRHLPSEKQFNFSLILDEVGAFFDTQHYSRLEMLLDAGFGGETKELTTRARSFMQTVLKHQITKYNNAPVMILPPKPQNRRRILVIDQTSGDLSIKFGQCGVFSFQDMLDHALAQADADVILKPHPESLAGAKGANFDIASLKGIPNLTILTENCNIMSLMPQVDEVYVMVSGVGLEALMAGKTVRCFGVPFYAGRGLTIDMVEPSRPRRPLSIEELVAGVFLQYHLWYDPVTGMPTTAEACLERLIPLLSQSTGLVYDGKRSHTVSLENTPDADAFLSLLDGHQPVDVRVADALVKLGDTVADVTDGSALFTISMVERGTYKVHFVSPEYKKIIGPLKEISDAIVRHKLPSENASAATNVAPTTIADLLGGEPVDFLRVSVKSNAVELLEAAQEMFTAPSRPTTILCFLPARAIPRLRKLLDRWYAPPCAAHVDSEGELHLDRKEAASDVYEGSAWHVFRAK